MSSRQEADVEAGSPAFGNSVELALALKAGGFGTWNLALENLQLACSATCKQNFGRDPARPFTYADLLACIHPDDRERMARAVQASIAEGGDYDIEYRIITATGEVRWVAVRGQPLLGPEGQVTRMAGVSQDITERKRQELRRLALADLSERIRDVSDPAQLAFIASEILARTLEVSRAGYGWIDPVAETIVIERDWNHPGVDSLAGVLRFRDYGHYIEDLKLGQTVVVADAYFDPRTAGSADSLKAISAQAFINMPVHEEGGLVALLYLNHAQARAWPEADIAFVREVAARTRTAEARRRAEINLRALTESLEQQVNARTQALMATEEALRQAQKMEAVGQLTGGVAHDFNNLLTVIRSSVDLLARPGLSEERRRRYVEAISSTVARASKLTSQLLAFARRQALQPEIFDVGASVTAISDMLATLVGSRVTIDMQIPSRRCLIHADHSQFDTALVNMAANARDAMSGQGTLTVALKPVKSIPALGAEALRPGPFVAVTLTDTGSGIEPADLERIFEPFFTTKPFGHGTGLGLSQVFGFARQSGGDVQVHSQVGQGTSMTLYLPQAHDAQACTGPEDAEPQGVEGNGMSVLVVEDNPEVGVFAAESLQELGYQAVWVISAEAALRTLESDWARFGVVFADVVMPGGSGLELADEIRQRYPELPVVVTSGYSHILEQHGSCGYPLMQKPYSVEQLSRVLHDTVSLHRMRFGG
ncbi:PAS domain-containing protein [Pseudomonas sp. nanlin1]|uniref:PAS domain-containing protein n=1 Tax=Pseudomonas sp. nanlin1 TaxID=3040605 RepID=UPI00389094AB